MIYKIKTIYKVKLKTGSFRFEKSCKTKRTRVERE